MSLPSIVGLRALQSRGEHTAVIEKLHSLGPTADETHLVLIKGISLALSGQLQEAFAFLNAANNHLTNDLGNVEHLSDLSLGQLLLGQPLLAVESARQALAQGCTDAVTQGRLGAACLSAGQLDAARDAYQEALALEPGRAEWHSNLGGILVRQQKLEDGLEQYELALRIDPDLDQAVQARMRVLTALERNEEVIDQLYVQLHAEPDKVSLRMRLARALAQGNRLSEAVATVRERLRPVEAIDIPEHATRDETEAEAVDGWSAQLAFRVLLADLFAQRHMHGKVLFAVNQALLLEPQDPLALLHRKVHALTELGRYEQAAAVLDEADETHPGATLLQTARAGLFTESGRYAEAEAIQRELIETYPGNFGLKSQLGQTLLWTGKLDEAAQLFEEAAEANPMALAQMVNAKRIPDDPAALEKMAGVADNPLIPDQARISMAFALAEVYDKRKEDDDAFHYLALANRLSDKTLNYDPAQFLGRVDEFIEIYTPEFFAAQPPIRSSERTPIFVVGMPRSGTTLTEQILCSHPDIFGAGELDLLPRLTRLMPKVIGKKIPYPKCLEAFTPHLREEGARFYLHGLDYHDTKHPYVVDKMPHNFMNLGLIALIFPKAKIVHIQRDPRDTALSNFQQNFKARHGGLGYAFNLVKIAHQINDYHRMMSHWREVLPIPMFELTYEEMVADQEGMTRKLLEFVGVDWDDKVRDFHKTERAVRTASVSQVRQPIYQTSKQKWRRYEQHLKPLLENLDPAVTAPFDKQRS